MVEIEATSWLSRRAWLKTVGTFVSVVAAKIAADKLSPYVRLPQTTSVSVHLPGVSGKSSVSGNLSVTVSDRFALTDSYSSALERHAGQVSLGRAAAPMAAQIGYSYRLPCYASVPARRAAFSARTHPKMVAQPAAGRALWV
jgi:hypothetical protein